MFLRDYIKEIHNLYRRGDATEESYYPLLSKLLEDYTKSIHRKIYITQLPKRTEAGNPDFRVWDGSKSIVGYIEAKKPEETDLSKVERSEQIKRYRNVFPNLILTNFTEFRYYHNGELREIVKISDPLPSSYPSGIKFKPESEKHFYDLLNKFLSYSLPQVHKPKDLAIELAKRTQLLKEIVSEELKNPFDKRNNTLKEFYEIFKKYLISDLSIEDFSDLYSQTIVYGLFAARTRSDNGFNRKLAYDQIPKTIGILRDIFRFISMEDIPPQMEWIIDDISELLAVSDVHRILEEYFHQNRGSDPIVHFYETFLSVYEPDIREKRGVYYTPEPIVLYMARSVNEILKSIFSKMDGLASEGVTVLDPSAGTLTFLAETTKLAVEEFINRYGSGCVDEFIKKHILKSFLAFEIMMAPYAVGHLKISFLLEELGYKLQDGDRFKFYLTNTLEMEPIEYSNLPYISSISEEANLAQEIKKEKPILVILGNPPYSGHSANKGEWISREIRAYYQVDGKPLGEKNPKWLQDDYVKFIRFAQWKIENSGEGILAFITNHSYIDNPTFRGMRKSLMDTFDEIYILDLHGNSKKKEVSPDGSKDENVFDIQQGVAIGIFVKKKGLGKKVFHSEIWGSREKKYEWLNANTWNTTRWKKLDPKGDTYLFIPHSQKYLRKYESFLKITEIFPIHSVGIVTARDSLTIQWTKEDIWQTINDFIRLDSETAREKYDLGKDVRDWKVKWAQQDIKNSGPHENNIVPILYRPFDIRYTYYTGKSRGFHCMPRPEVMRNMLNKNLGLISIRRSRCSQIWNFAFVTETIISGATAISALDINHLFPLYIYDTDGNKRSRKRRGSFISSITLFLFEPPNEYLLRRPNLSQRVVEYLADLYGLSPSPENIFHYIYAILYSTSYRSKYTELLRLDFPRIPFPKEYKLFKKMMNLGELLVNAHLLRDIGDISPITRFEGKGDGIVEIVEFRRGKIFINEGQYFENISNDTWNYHIGGYQVLNKWLRDRKGRKLNMEEIKLYCNIVGALEKTQELQARIDKVFNEIEEED